MKTEQSQEHLLTRHHLAERWSISIETLKRREKSGHLPYLKLGTRVRYRMREIEKIEQDAEVRH